MNTTSVHLLCMHTGVFNESKTSNLMTKTLNIESVSMILGLFFGAFSFFTCIENAEKPDIPVTVVKTKTGVLWILVKRHEYFNSGMNRWQKRLC